jgi:hypothetical protein
MYPKIDDGGNFIFDQNGEVEMVNIKVRDRADHQHRNILENYVKLMTRCPELVIKYPWTDEEDKAALCCSLRLAAQRAPMLSVAWRLPLGTGSWAAAAVMRLAEKLVSVLTSKPLPN